MSNWYTTAWAVEQYQQRPRKVGTRDYKVQTTDGLVILSSLLIKGESKSHLRNLRKALERDQLSGKKIGNAWYVDAQEGNEFLEQRRQNINA